MITKIHDFGVGAFSADQKKLMLMSFDSDWDSVIAFSREMYLKYSEENVGQDYHLLHQCISEVLVHAAAIRNSSIGSEEFSRVWSELCVIGFRSVDRELTMKFFRLFWKFDYENNPDELRELILDFKNTIEKLAPDDDEARSYHLNSLNKLMLRHGFSVE